MADLYPLKLAPQPSERLWGGTTLASYVPDFATLQTAEPIGEAWLVYADNQIINGSLAGQTLQQVADALQASLLGTKSAARYGSKVPLLAKFLDAAQDLSVQVHPGDDYALSREAATGHLGKTEAWYILSAEPGSRIFWDFKEAVSPEQLRTAIDQGELESLLNSVEVRAGDIIFNPAGKVHAVGAGIVLFEIQQASDLTYRLYDFNRRGADGKLRELHIDKALDVMNVEPGRNAKVSPQRLSDHVLQLVSSDYFVMERWDINEALLNRVDPASMETLTVLAGEVTLTYCGVGLELHRGESVVLPALLGEYQLAGEGQLIRCFVPS